MIRRVPLLVALVVYVTLDLSLPAMPGAFVFDAASSVESAQRNRPGTVSDVVFALAPARHGDAVVERAVRVPRPVLPPREVACVPLRQPARPTLTTAPRPPSDDPH